MDINRWMVLTIWGVRAKDRPRMSVGMLFTYDLHHVSNGKPTIQNTIMLSRDSNH